MEAATDLDRFITLEDAAKRLGVSVQTARRWTREGRFPVEVQLVGGSKRVSLRRLVEFMAGEAQTPAAS